MEKLKFPVLLIFSLFMLAGCSILTDIKNKIISGGKNVSVTEKSGKNSNEEDLNFYNKYIEVMNKIQERGGNVYKFYISEVPAPGSVKRNSFILNMSMKTASQMLGSTVKEYKRSLLDEGELSKLKASAEMQNTLETDLKNLLPVMEEYYNVSEIVSEYYFDRVYKNDLSKVIPYDEDMKNSYNKFKTELDKFSSDIKKFKPARIIYDPTAASDPDEASSQIMLNAYGNMLESAESFYEGFEKIEYGSDLSETKKKFEDFVKTYGESKNSVMSAEFSEKVKFMKYHFEDYFSPSAENFINDGKIFFLTAKEFKNEKEFKLKYNELLEYYNKMISSYNTSVETINRVRTW
ncbi:MAG: DUF3829 domain-containing protein [Bacteroidetes bacterium]|nr:DUF3829 domain-containing protein [Bacteroidota bacterium]